MKFTFRHEPFDHQLEEFELSKDMTSRCVWWEMGTGKTKVAIDTLAHLRLEGRVAGAVVLAPNGVHQNWALDELPEHLPEELSGEARVFLWESAKRKRQWFKRAWEEFELPGGLPILCLSYDSLMTTDTAMAVRGFMQSRPCLYVADETSYPGAIKSPGSKTATRVLASAKYAPYRRVLDGTPLDDSPFQAYTQCKFADPGVWRREFGIENFQQFKTYFGVWRVFERKDNGRKFKALVEYRNMSALNRVMGEMGSRKLKSEVLDLPDKLYRKVYYDLSSEQRRMYDELERDFVAWFGDGSKVSAKLAIVRLTRMQQVCSGYLPADEEDGLRPIPGATPRLDLLLKEVAAHDDQAMIWGKYDVDVDGVAAALRGAGHSVVTYDGRTSQADRQRAKDMYRSGDARFFVGKPSSCGRGLTLVAGDKVYYYNNSFSLDQRRQSEDRAHRIGQTRNVTYVDLVANDSVDQYILRVLRGKREVAGMVMGDELPPWV